jgi:hypothetical protein
MLCVAVAVAVPESAALLVVDVTHARTHMLFGNLSILLLSSTDLVYFSRSVTLSLVRRRNGTDC